MNATEARAVIKAINRHLKRVRAFSGGRAFGVDWPTFNATFPQLSEAYRKAGAVIAGRYGFFMPPARVLNA